MTADPNKRSAELMENPADDPKACLACIGAPGAPHICGEKTMTAELTTFKKLLREATELFNKWLYLLFYKWKPHILHIRVFLQPLTHTSITYQTPTTIRTGFVVAFGAAIIAI